MNQKLVPIPGATSPRSFNGAIYTPSEGVLDIATNNLAAPMLAQNGWAMLPQHGTTSQRPTTAAQGAPFCDDTLSEVVFALTWPLGSGKVVGWCDMNGNSV